MLHQRGTVLLQHESSGSLLVASRTSKVAFYAKSTMFNKDSWASCGIKSKTGMSFFEPKQGFVVGQHLLFDNVPYEVVGFNAHGWLSAWDDIVLAAKSAL